MSKYKDDADVFEQNEIQELFMMYLIALLATYLDDIDQIAGSHDVRWKKRAIELCLSSNPKAKGFLHPWLENPKDARLTSEPLIGWFRAREREGSVEGRRRANGLRTLLEYIVRGGGVYDARVRAALKQIAHGLNVSWSRDVSPFENSLAQEIVSPSATMQGQSAPQEQQSRAWSASRIAKVSAAAALGGTAIALTAGAAAPLLAPIFGAFFATGAAASVALSVGLFGAAGAGLTGYKMADRTKTGLHEFFFEQVDRALVAEDTRRKVDEQIKKAPSLHLVLGISGSMDSADTEAVKEYWSNALSYEAESKSEFGWSDLFVLVYDRDALLAYSRTVKDLLKDQVVSYAYSYFLKQVVGHALMAAVSLPMTVANASDFINNSFVLCERRSRDAGQELAAALRLGYQGARPVTLVGFGFGALTIFHCLEALGKEQALGIVEDVVMVGAPLRANTGRWQVARKIVAGRLVNVYCEEDWTLKLAMEWTTSASPVAGVEPVNIRGVRDHKTHTNHYRIGADLGVAMCQLLKEVLNDDAK